jgi:tetratricopeptide (TPR) repeat protein
MKTKPFLLLLLLFLIAPATGFAQVGRIRGTVSDTEGNPLKDARIEITGMDVKRKYKLKTNKKGEYLHIGIVYQGVYRIMVTKEGYQRDFVEGVRASLDPTDEDRGVYHFQLQPLGGQTERRLSYELTDEERAEVERAKAERERQAEAATALGEKFDQALQEIETGNYEQAVRLLTEAAAIDATQAAVWSRLAEAQTGLGNQKEALSAYEKAAMLQPDPAIYQNMGNAYAELGDSQKAQEYYAKAVAMSAETDPSAAAATYYNMAVGHINANQTQKAREALQKALELDPGFAEAHYQLGIILTNDMRAIPQAVEHLKKYLELAPEGPNAEMARLLVEGLSG